MPIKALKRRLEHAAKEMQASSCIFYVRDPHWINEYRPVAMTGVLHKETMYGFLASERTRKVVFKGELEQFNSNAFKGDISPELLSIIENIPKENRPLFGDFSQREGVQSSARLIHLNADGEREAILFVNFSETINFDAHEELKTKIRELFQELVVKLDDIQGELVKSHAEWFGQATKIVSPAWSVVNFDFSDADTPGPYFDFVIRAVLEALDIAPDMGVGTIHLYNAEEQTLELHGFYGEIGDRKTAKRSSVRDGMGIISWVALRKRALLLRELETSDYRNIHIKLDAEIKSELAVPLEADGELIGVMCLESREANKFLPHHVRSVWYAANKATVAYMLYLHASMNRMLLKLGWQATLGEKQALESLTGVARLAKQYLKASYCEIWRYNVDAMRFDNWGASYEGFKPHGRLEGWTDFVRRSKCPIWISDIKNDQEYTVHHFANEQWINGTPTDDCPTELNPVPITQKSRHELAIPIIVQNDCVGVAWIKYRRAGLEPPKPVLMSLALGFAAQAGLVLDSIQRRKVDLKEKESLNHYGEDIASEIKSRWDFQQSEILDAAVVSAPFHSSIGGDYYARKAIDPNTVGILLVDGQGHGLQGTLHMLPLMTTFQSYWESYSAAHVMSHLIKTAEEMNVRGTAIYCIISKIDKSSWLCVTSAGHESLIIFKKDGRGKWETEHQPSSNGLMLGAPLKEPLMDHRLGLSAGDIIVGYTDGIIDGSQHFDDNNLSAFIFNLLCDQIYDPAAIAHAIMNHSREKHPEGFTDDATVFVVRVN